MATKPAAFQNSPQHAYSQGLNERYTFENFIVGSSNELAFAACQSVVSLPGSKYNPLVLYGGVGIGKTHLLQAVGNAILQKNPDAKILYISTEQFVREFVEAIRFKKTAEFAGYYRTADILIVDDIQFIAGKEKIQEESSTPLIPCTKLTDKSLLAAINSRGIFQPLPNGCAAALPGV